MRQHAVVKNTPSRYHYFAEWQKESVWERMHDALRDELRQASGKKSSKRCDYRRAEC